MSDRRVLDQRFALTARLGTGGMGSVWRADDLLLERTVALKELVPDVKPEDLAERRLRAAREARTLARVKHPAIVRIHDLFYESEDPWIVMEYVDGRSLAHIIGDGPIDEREIARIGLPVLQGLGAAHDASIVHRDVKPANILVADRDRSVFLVDFGIARSATDLTMTADGKVIGTPEFLAPEQLSGPAIGPACDLWALGVTLFYALEGYSPFRVEDDQYGIVTMNAIMNSPPPPIRRPGRLAELVLSLLQKDPAARPRAKDVAMVLKTIRSGPTRSRGSLPPDPGATWPPASPPEPRPDAPLTGRPLQDALALVQGVGPLAGADALLAMRHDHAATVLAGCAPRKIGPLLEAVLTERPDAAAPLLQSLPPVLAGRAADHMDPARTAAILTSLPPSGATQILNGADVRTAAEVIMKLPSAASAALISTMPGDRAASVLEFVRPAAVAALLAVSEELNGRLLARLKPPFRALVMRHLPSGGPVLSRLSD